MTCGSSEVQTSALVAVRRPKRTSSSSAKKDRGLKSPRWWLAGAKPWPSHAYRSAAAVVSYEEENEVSSLRRVWTSCSLVRLRPETMVAWSTSPAKWSSWMCRALDTSRNTLDRKVSATFSMIDVNWNLEPFKSRSGALKLSLPSTASMLKLTEDFLWPLSSKNVTETRLVEPSMTVFASDADSSPSSGASLENKRFLHKCDPSKSSPATATRATMLPTFPLDRTREWRFTNSQSNSRSRN
mmetsp:Transcript_3955/g.12283  ORF Transcript_3955/g.12283 Transcript_3955/m.12283 type:complete len:241 (+) Transcript_3955:837-1559(+)